MTDPTGEPQSGSKGHGIRLTEALVLAAAPVVAVVLTFAYESGYVGWFGVPNILVRIDPTTILLCATATALLVSGILWYARLVPTVPWRAAVCVLYLLLVSVGLILWGAAEIAQISTNSLWSWIWRSVVGSGLTLAGIYALYDLLVRPIRDYKEHGGWGERWIRRAGELAPKRPVNLQSAFHEQVWTTLGPRASGILLVVLLSSGLLYWWGMNSAARATVHLVLREAPPCIVIRRYGEGLLCVAVDTSSWTVLPNYRVLPLIDNVTTFSMITTGPLTRVQFPSAIRNANSGKRQ